MNAPASLPRVGFIGLGVLGTPRQQLWRAAAEQAEPEASVSELVRWVERTSGTEISAGAVPRLRP